MIELRTLGALDLRGADGHDLRSVLAQPKRLALLVYLSVATPRGFRRRDSIVALFWPELDQERARRALRQALHFLRVSLGEGVLVRRGEEELGISDELLWCDAVAFAQAYGNGELWKALDLYRGDLLEGFFVAGAPEFERWLDDERGRLRRCACQAAWAAAERCKAEGKLALAASTARRALALAPDDEATLRRLITLLDSIGDRAGAVRAYEDFARHLAEEYDVKPSVETEALIGAVRSRAAPLASVARSGAGSRVGELQTSIGQGERVHAGGFTVVDGRYSLEHELGHSGMARVYLARDRKHNRPVVIKVLYEELAAALSAERFQREIKLLAQLQHPHILALYDSGQAEGALYYVMPFVAGESVRELLDRKGRVPLTDALRIAGAVADALAYAHAHDVIHRDIKPDTILLAGAHAHTLVTDFGIARAITRTGGDRLTQAGHILGTPAYMSPEQASGRDDLDDRSDVYSLGCALYEMLAGVPPFRGPTAAAVMARHRSDPVPRVARSREDIPKEIDAAVARALAKAPADRFASAAEFGGALRGATDLAIRALATSNLVAPQSGRPLP